MTSFLILLNILQRVAIYLFKGTKPLNIGHFGNSSKLYVFILQTKSNFLSLHNFTKCVNQRVNKCLNGHLTRLYNLLFSAL